MRCGLFHVLGLACGLLGCSVDDRRLEPAGSAATDANTAGASDGSAGDGGTPPAPDASGLADGCADLDTDGVGDCTVTLVQNPSFASDVSHWTAGANTTWTWDPQDALADTQSGSGKLTTQAPRGSVSQCVPVSSEREVVIAYASVFVEPPEEGTSLNQADVSAAFFASSDCSGASVGSFETPPSAGFGAWSVVQAGGYPAEAIGSISIALNAIKGTAAASVTVFFDDVLLRTKASD